MRKSQCNLLIEEFPHLYKDKKPEEKRPRYYMQIGGFETSQGWYDLLRELSISITMYLETNPIEGFEVNQVKQKFGYLCYYVSKCDPIIRELIRNAGREASVTCEDCGSKDRVTIKGSPWISCLCDTCREK